MTAVGGRRGARHSRRRIAPTLVVYILRELIPPTLMGFGLFTFFLLMNTLLQLAETIIRDRVPAADVGLLFLYNVPHVIVLTLPMSILVGGLIAFGRMSADSEIIALRSAGVSLFQVAMPIMLLASVAAAITLYLYVVALPWGNYATVQHQPSLINTRTITGEIRPRVFESRFPNVTIFVQDTEQQGRVWKNLMLVKTDTNPPLVSLANSARLLLSDETKEAWLELENGYNYDGGDIAEESGVVRFQMHEVLLDLGIGLGNVAATAKDERTMTLAELRDEVARRDSEGISSRSYRVEIHKKFAIPLACLVLGLIAVPLGASTRRHTTATGYLMAIGVIAVYYMFIDGGEKFAEEGAVQVWLGIWSGNIVLGGAALFLLWNRAREKDYGIADKALAILARLGERLAGAWRASPGAPTREYVKSASAATRDGKRKRFPRILDRYVLSQFARTFALTMGGLTTIWLIGEYFEISDDIYAAGASRWLILEYFQFQLPFIVSIAIPIATIVTVLVVFSLMSKQNEVVAALAGGISLFRLAAPILIPAVGLTVVEYAVTDYIAPPSNQRAAEIRQQVRGSVATTFRPAQGNWVRGEGDYIFNFADYDAETQLIQGLRIYHLDAEQWRLAREVSARRARWVDGRWLATDAWNRHYLYSDDGARITSPPLMRLPAYHLPITETPEYFRTERRLPEQMSARELGAHIQNLEARGFDAGKYHIDLQQKFAFPAVVFVLAMVGIPFGFRMGRQGTLSGVAVALGLTVLFWLTFAFFRAVGASEMLPAPMAAWAPHGLFLALAGYVTAGLKT